MTKSKFLERAREIHGYKYEYPSLGDKVLSNDDIDIIHNGVLYKQKVVKHILLGRCPEKNTPKKDTYQFIENCKKIWGDKYDYSLVEYSGALNKVKIIFEGIIFEQVAVSHISGQAPEKHLNQESFIRKCIEKHGNRYDYSLVKFVSGKIAVMIGYNGTFYLQKPYHHLSGKRPENISLSVRKTTRKFIIESNLVHDYKYNYDKTDYVKNNIKVIITCPIHGDFLQNPLSHIQGCGCSNCNESKGEREVAKFLNSHSITYNRQHKFEGCKNIFQLPFDFYIPSIRACIEFDGIQHFQPMEFFGGLKAYESLKINDKIKSDYCEEEYIDLIRIRYDDDIYKILWDNLKTHIKIEKTN